MAGLVLLAAAAFIVAAVLLDIAHAQTGSIAPEETPEVLPEGPGREETFYACTACHGIALVRQQGMTRERWDETIQVMIDKHGMTPYDGELRDLIVDYLAMSFPPRRRAPVNPFLR